MENNSNKLDKLMKLSIIAGIFIMTSTTIYYFLFFLPNKENKSTEVSKNEVVNDEISIENETKKDSLRKFYNNLVSAGDSHDWSTLYDLQPLSLHKVMSKDEFISKYKEYEDAKDIKPYSESTEIVEVTVDGNKGTVHRIITSCITEACDGENKKIDDGFREYEFVNNKWQKPDPEPSERSLSVASNIYIEIISKKDTSKNEFFNKYSFGKENLNYALRIYALELDENNEQLVYAESVLNKINNKSYSNNDYISPNNFNNQPADNYNKSVLDEMEQDREKRCQQEQAKYSSCMSEYNTKLSEYNSCLSETSNPNSYRYNGFCSKPFKLCIKPSCTY